MGRIRFGLKNLYYAIATEGAGGALTYATPVAIPGAKSIALSAAGDSMDEYADDVVWYHSDANQGYTGTLEFEDTAAGDAFQAAVLGLTTDNADVVWESGADQTKEFALLGQFSLAGGTETGKRFALLRCVISRPELNGQTKESGITVQTNTVNLTVMPRVNDDLVKATAPSTSAAYANWFSAVPTVAQ